MTQPEKIDYIINKGCEYFGLTPDDLLRKTGTRSNVHRMKRYIALIILDHTETTMAGVATTLGFWNKDSVSSAIKKIRDELSDEFYGMNKTKIVYNELLKYLDYEKE